MKINATKTDSSPIYPLIEDDEVIRPVDSHTEQALDEALRETFPASDAVAIDITKLRPIYEGVSSKLVSPT